MPLRDHAPFVIEEFNGLWDRDSTEICPSDHFNVADNVKYFDSGVETRDPLDKYQIPDFFAILRKVLRVYNYVTQSGQTLLVLVEGGTIHHMINRTVIFESILSIPDMTDFGFVAIAGRAYITPFTTYMDTSGQNYELGLPGESLYVYDGLGHSARKAGGSAPISGTGTPYAPYKPFIAFNDVNDGTVTRGVHLIGISFDGNNMGPISTFLLPAPFANHSMLPVVNAPGNLKIQLNNIPLSPTTLTLGRFINMTRVIDPKFYDYVNPPPFYIVEILPPSDTNTTRLIDVSDASLTSVFTPNISSPFFISNAMMVVGTATPGFTDVGFHLVGVVYETDTGYLTSPGPEFFGGNTYIDPTKSVMVLNIPISPDSNVIKRHLVSTKTINSYNGDQKGYQFFFIPNGTLNDNTTQGMEVSYYDSDLLADASHLMDNFETIPAGVSLCTYHSRLVLVGDPTIPDPDTFRSSSIRATSARPDNRSVAWVSAPGEPEAISKVDGLIIAPLDGNPLTNCQEFRDILYLFKKSHTYGYADNLDVPSTWQEKVIDQAIGAPVHGIGTVLDSGGVNIDFLLIADFSGIMLFNGTYARPELSWKIEKFWLALDRDRFRNIQLSNDSIGKKIYITLPKSSEFSMLYADYSKGLDPQNIKWARWIFDDIVTSTCLINTNMAIIGVGGSFIGGVYFINPGKTAWHDSYNDNIEKKIPDPIIRTALLGE